ncbi:MAG: 50S ribosomal protein L6 [Myxococcota bacterium]
MSRIGRKEIDVPAGVTVRVDSGHLAVKGPRGELRRPLPPGVKLQQEGPKLKVQRVDESRTGAALHGLARALLQNLVTGVSKGFQRKLEINGVGYRAEVSGSAINFTLGYSHPVVFALPTGVKATVEKNFLTLDGADREVLGQTAARIRALRGPEPYKGKGIKYVEEIIQRKVGKTGASA